MGLFSKKSVSMLLNQVSAFLCIAVVDVSRATHSRPQLVFSAEGDVVNGVFSITEIKLQISFETWNKVFVIAVTVNS
jgi:hypothetical protein